MRYGKMFVLTMAVLFAFVAIGRAQTVVHPGFNLFTTQQDIEIGRQSAAQIESQLPMIRQGYTSRYVSDLGNRLARYAPGAKYPYQFKVVNVSDVNAFALPGGYVYVHRGLIEVARTEGELAGVLAHEIAHVALRHPTNRVTKASVANAGLGVLGGLLGSRSSSNIVRAVGGFGLNSYFLKNSRSAEEQADIVGAQIMGRAGYDPREMANFFDTLRRQAGGNPSKFATFFSDHPAPANRAARVRREASLIGAVGRASPIGDIEVARAELRRMRPAPTRAQLAQGTASPATAQPASAEPPSSRDRVFRQAQDLFTIRYPDNWRSYSSSGVGATFAPVGGIVEDGSGNRRVGVAVIVNHYVPFDGAIGNRYRDPLGSLFGSSSLEEATSDLVRNVMKANPYLEPVPGSSRTGSISGQRSLRIDLSGTPPGGRPEQVRVYSRELPDGHVIYVLAIAPSAEYEQLRPTFDHMIGTLAVNERGVHD